MSLLRSWKVLTMTHLLDPDAMVPVHERMEEPHGPSLDNAVFCWNFIDEADIIACY